MLAEIKHKLMRTETLLYILNRCYTESRSNWKQAFEQQVLGMIVLTEYNNTTYRISDVIYDATPLSTFETRNGPISYIDYYKTVSIFLHCSLLILSVMYPVKCHHFYFLSN